ncbi:MAG: ASKHA domain-containing protein [Elusimicrobia bacterium]|nr:ASKHA domain-containing protein [Elusimicrobiota bacterium]
MSTIKVTFQPDSNTISVPAGITIKEAAILAGIIIDAPCGGEGKCGKCKVTIIEGVSSPNSVEQKLIQQKELKKGVRLSCQTKIFEEMTIVVSEEMQLDRKKLFISTKPLSQLDNISKNLGLAVDIGTTTIVGVLVDLESKKTLSVSTETNPQFVHGADVISRINYSINNENGLNILQAEVIKAINFIINKLTATTNTEAANIHKMTVAGNTTMQHLFLGISPKSLALAPYQPPVKGSYKPIKASEIGIKINADAEIYLIPNIGGWVGGDTVGMILALELHKSNKLKLAIDIGTNGEIVLGSKKRLITASTAAGPCFEGANIKCGMRATSGAIESVYIADEGVFWRVIGKVEAKGICGSALIDTVADLLKYKIVDETGKIQFKQELKAKLPPVLLKSIIKHEKEYSFILTKSKTNNVEVTQKDIRELQLAKAAIYAGVQILIKELGIKTDDIDEVLLSGTFGNYIDKANAHRIGLLPDVPLEKVKYVGNSACEGALLALISKEAREEAEDISKNTEYIELTNRPDFQNAFVDALYFPQYDSDENIIKHDSDYLDSIGYKNK